MAFSAVTARGSATSVASASTIAMSPSANLTVGKLVVVNVVVDNYVTSKGSSAELSLADSKSNTWVKIGEYSESDGVAADGVTIASWYSIITTQIATTDTITCTLAHAVTRRIISTFEATKTAGTSISVAQLGWGQTQIEATVTGLVPNTEYLLIGHGGSEGNDNTKTPDADYTELFDLRTGTGTTEIAQHVVRRIWSPGTYETSDTCTSSGWTYTNPMFMLAALQEYSAVDLRVTHAGAYLETEREAVSVTHVGAYIETERKALSVTHVGVYLEIETHSMIFGPEGQMM